jgi:riboflavin kinase/FMN adenylyltransferase
MIFGLVRQRAGDYEPAGPQAGQQRRAFEVARMNSYEITYPKACTNAAEPVRVSSTEVRAALAAGRHGRGRAQLLGRPYTISAAMWCTGASWAAALAESQPPALGDGFRTLNLRFAHWKPAASGIFAVWVHGLAAEALPGVANLGIRPSLDPSDVNGGRVLLETHCLEWPQHLGAEGAYGKIIRVELMHKLHDELRYDSLGALTAGIARDCADARAWFAAHAETRRQTTRDRI